MKVKEAGLSFVRQEVEDTQKSVWSATFRKGTEEDVHLFRRSTDTVSKRPRLWRRASLEGGLKFFEGGSSLLLFLRLFLLGFLLLTDLRLEAVRLRHGLDLSDT